MGHLRARSCLIQRSHRVHGHVLGVSEHAQQAPVRSAIDGAEVRAVVDVQDDAVEA